MQQSWSDKMVEGIRNIIKRDHAGSINNTYCKEAKKLMSRYPVTSALAENLVEVAEDSESLEQHTKAIKDEMSKQMLWKSLLAH